MLRNVAYKIGRKLYFWARKETPNSPEENGEFALLSHVLSETAGPATVLDVGANRGEWSRKAVSLARANRLDVCVHAFEPLSGTRALLEKGVAELPEVRVHSVALSNAPGTAAFYSQSAGSGTSSLHPVSGNRAEDVKLATLDAWIADQQCTPVRMIKIDVEGFDSLVLEGAARTLQEGLVDVVQFEYNWRWLLNSRSLHWVFQFIEDKPYIFGKVVPDGVITFERWHFELDRFFEGNYLLLRRDSAVAQLGRPAWFDQSNVLRLA
ncbi:MAG: FkbM family methyltransferase [Arenimonas sp.]|uniref:FkbM family methyltransferase n=1 Tax=Arenimonas sp. TaxID=1872635 RepID=UPI0025BE599D|nr:FkbM family methyltransferase [Arenimonas sp.]MBW8366834.1 FkbM family methyltransferase [Arenimonas sp.]